MKYQTYEISIVVCDGLRWITFPAIDMSSAHADIRATYGDDVEIVCTRTLYDYKY